MAGRTRLMKEMQEIKREAARGRAEKDVKLEPDEADIYTWKAKIKVGVRNSDTHVYTHRQTE